MNERHIPSEFLSLLEHFYHLISCTCICYVRFLHHSSNKDTSHLLEIGLTPIIATKEFTRLFSSASDNTLHGNESLV